MLAMIWHEIGCWFLKIYQDFKRFATQEQKIVFDLTFRCAKQFFVPNTQKQSKRGKNPEINRQSFVIWWHDSRKYRSVWYSLSCTSQFSDYCHLTRNLKSLIGMENISGKRRGVRNSNANPFYVWSRCT